MSQTDQQITLARCFAQEGTGREGAIAVAPDTDIIGEGLVDSLGILKLIASVPAKCTDCGCARNFPVFEPNELPRAHLFDAKRLGHSWCQPLNDPVWTDAYDHLRDDDPVLGLYLSRRTWALPWWIMKNHHVANLTFDGLPVLVTLCEMCSGAAAFRAEVEGRRLTFRLRGQYNATILLEETSTESLWSPFTGVALAGVMRGAGLEQLPLSQCRWSEWLAMHPTTEVLYGEQALREGHGSEYSPGSPGIGREFGATLVRPLDERLPHNTLVLGVNNEANARAYPLDTLARIGPVLNDSLGGAEIVVRCRPGTLQALAFHRRVGDQVLAFGHSETRGVYDEQTGSVWNEMGEAVSGPLAGTQLVYLRSGIEEWYAFAAYHPDTEIFDAI
jgi:hypothetical protein